MDVQGKNIMMAEFVGLSKQDKTNDCSGVFLYESPITGEYIEEHELNFDGSWDWMMIAIQKCYEIISPLLDTGKNHDQENLIGDITSYLTDGQKEDCFRAVSLAIEYFNVNHLEHKTVTERKDLPINFWGIIEKHLSDYFHSGDVAISNDLTCYVEEKECMSPETLKETEDFIKASGKTAQELDDEYNIGLYNDAVIEMNTKTVMEGHEQVNPRMIIEFVQLYRDGKLLFCNVARGTHVTAPVEDDMNNFFRMDENVLFMKK